MTRLERQRQSRSVCPCGPDCRLAQVGAVQVGLPLHHAETYLSLQRYNYHSLRSPSSGSLRNVSWSWSLALLLGATWLDISGQGGPCYHPLQEESRTWCDLTILPFQSPMEINPNSDFQSMMNPNFDFGSALQTDMLSFLFVYLFLALAVVVFSILEPALPIL